FGTKGTHYRWNNASDCSYEKFCPGGVALPLFIQCPGNETFQRVLFAKALILLLKRDTDGIQERGVGFSNAGTKAAKRRLRELSDSPAYLFLGCINCRLHWPYCPAYPDLRRYVGNFHPRYSRLFTFMPRRLSSLKKSRAGIA